MASRKYGAGVFEVSSRVSTNNVTDEVVEGLAGHQSEKNTSAHGISNIDGLREVLNQKEDMFSKNTAFNKNFGTTSGTVCQGNDSRLSDARTPKAHTHIISDVSGLQTTLDSKQNIISGHSGTLTIVTSVDFVNQTFQTAQINVSNGIITKIN